MNLPLKIRPIQPSEISFLDEMLYEAIFIPEGEDKLPKEIIYRPELLRYVANFGKTGDNCLVAQIQGNLIGAIWTRLFSANEKGYGYLNDETPELSMAISIQYRHQGIGRQLLDEMIKILSKQQYDKVSLSVDKRNYAFEFYKNYGFIVVDSHKNSATMIYQL